MTIDPAQFRYALGQFASGVTIVTTLDAAGTPLGLTVSAFCSASLQPPLVAIYIDLRSETQAGFQASGLFGVSVLAEDQEALSRRFAVSGPGKFDGLEPVVGTTGVWLIPGALAHLECRIVATHPAGDHTLYLGEIVALSVQPGAPLVYHRGLYRKLGPDPRSP